MKNISLKLQENIFEDTEYLVSFLQKSRNKYINEAIAFYNQHQRKRLLAEQLKKESAMIANDSMNILNEFEQINDGF